MNIIQGVLVILKILMILSFYEVLGGVVNNILFKKEKLNILFGFIYNVIIIQIITLFLIPFHVPLIVVEILYLGIILFAVLLLIVKKPKILITQFNFKDKIKKIKKLDIFFSIILFILFWICTTTSEDQWLYGTLVNSAFTKHGIQSQIGGIDYFFADKMNHMFNSYYVYNAMIIDLLKIDYVSYTFGIYRIIEIVIFLQVIRGLQSFLSKKTNRNYLLLFLGLVGLNIFSNNIIYNPELTLLFNGNNGTEMFYIIAPLLVFLYLYRRNEKYLLLFIIFSFAVTTTIIMVFPLIMIATNIVFKEKTKKSFLLYIIMLLPYTTQLLSLGFEYFCVVLLILLVMYVGYVFLNTKLIMILMIILFLLFFDFNFLKILVYTNRTNLIITLLIIFLYRKSSIYTEDIFKYLLLLIFFSLLLNSRYEEINSQYNVIKSRIVLFLPANLILINFIDEYISNKVLWIFSFIVIAIMSKSYYNNTYDINIRTFKDYVTERPEYDSHREYLINNKNIIDILNEFEEDIEYDIFFADGIELSDSSDPATEMQFISAFNANINIYDDQHSEENYCVKADVECYIAYSKNGYELVESDNSDKDFQTKDYYMIYDEK